MDIKYTFQDNYLNTADYKNLKKIIMGGKFPWYFKKGVVALKDKNVSPITV